MKTVVLNYGSGNIKSLSNALNYIEFDHVVSNDIQTIKESGKLIIQGAGSFANAIKSILSLSLRDVLLDLSIHKQIPVLGICLGMQIFAKSGSEGGWTDGLWFLNGDVTVMNPPNFNLKIPYYGWSSLTNINYNSRLMRGISETDSFYFVHSYKYEGESVSARYLYDGNVTASVEKDNLFGVQFHPEKSRHSGLQVLKNFRDIQ